MEMLEVLNNKFLDIMLLVILMGGYILIMTMGDISVSDSPNSPNSSNSLNKQFRRDFKPYADYIDKVNAGLKFNINDLDGRIDNSNYSGQYGFRNGDLGPVINFHQKFRLNKLAHAGNAVITSDLNNRGNLYATQLGKKGDSESAVKELGWRNWWLRQKSMYGVANSTDFANIPTRNFLNKLENTENIYLQKK